MDLLLQLHPISSVSQPSFKSLDPPRPPQLSRGQRAVSMWCHAVTGAYASHGHEEQNVSTERPSIDSAFKPAGLF